MPSQGKVSGRVWLLIARWLFASTLGVEVNSFLVSQIPSYSQLFPGAILGLLVGFLQWLLCREYLEISPGWIIGTMIGSMFVFSISMSVDMALVTNRAILGYATVFGVMGGFIGVAQGRSVSVSGLFSLRAWVAITVASWIGAFFVGLLFARVTHEIDPQLVLISGLSFPGVALIVRSNVKAAKEDLLASTFD